MVKPQLFLNPNSLGYGAPSYYYGEIYPLSLELHFQVGSSLGEDISTITGWWLTYPSEKSWSSSVGMIILFQCMESHNPAMFQSPPISDY